MNIQLRGRDDGIELAKHLKALSIPVLLISGQVNLIRQADDDGYRKWAMAAPSCSGLIGCGPQYLERWTMKRSTLALGDILADSRDAFSSGGLSDVTLAGLILSYALRDFGTVDGDIVNVSVSQFGRILQQNNNLVLTGEGTSFSVPVQRGVAILSVTAVNEGSIPPNTAALSILGISGGSGNQSYSLGTGGTSDLKVTVGGGLGVPSVGGN